MVEEGHLAEEVSLLEGGELVVAAVRQGQGRGVWEEKPRGMMPRSSAASTLASGRSAPSQKSQWQW